MIIKIRLYVGTPSLLYMWFAGVPGCGSFIGWLRSKMICIGCVGVADAGVIGRFIEILAVSGFEFGLG